jgi:hemoglobin
MQQQPLEAPNAPGEAPVRSLFERIGGRATVERIVDDFYARIEADPDMRPLFPADMGPGREKQKLFMEQWLGGEPRYSESFGHPRLRRRHFPFAIEERHAGRWLHHMTSAMRAAGVSDSDIAEILAGLGPLAHHMVNAGEDVPREPMGDVRLV